MDLNKAPKQVNDLIAFEDNLIVLAQDIRLQKQEIISRKNCKKTFI